MSNESTSALHCEKVNIWDAEYAMEEQWMEDKDYNRLMGEFGVIGMSLKKAKVRIARFCSRDNSYMKLGAELLVELTRRSEDGKDGSCERTVPEFDEISRRVFFTV